MNDVMEPSESRLHEIARDFPYPPTPDIARGVRDRLADQSHRAALVPRPVLLRHRALVGALLVLILFAGLMAVPPVRAAVIEFLQVGVIRIFLAEPSPTPTPTATSVPTPGVTLSPTQAFTPTPGDMVSLAQIAGETTLESALAQASYALRMPAYPPDLGDPDRVFVQDADQPVVILVWTAPEDPEKASLILFQIPPDSWMGKKVVFESIQQTQVNQQEAVWAIGPHFLLLNDGNVDLKRFVTGRVLIWAENDITYRLESELSLEEAIRVAESLAPIP